MKYEKGGLYAYPGTLDRLRGLINVLTDMEKELAATLRDELLQRPPYSYGAPVKIPRFPPFDCAKFVEEPAALPEAMTVPYIEFKRMEYRIVLWECLAGDKEDEHARP